MSTENDTLQQQLIKELLVEGFEGLERLDRELLTLEQGAASSDTLNTIFRVVHTIKGTAGCIGLQQIESVAHVGENLLSLVRDGEVQVHTDVINTLLQFSDALKDMLRSLERTGTQGNADHSALLARLRDLQQTKQAGSTPVSAGVPAPAATAASDASPAPASPKWGLFSDDEPLAASPPPPPTPPAHTATAVHTASSHPTPTASGLESPAANGAHAPGAESARPTEGVRSGASVSESAIRIDVEQLDKLMNLVGELVLARNQIIQHAAHAAEATLVNASQRLNIITTELQESVMKTRMQPIETVWSKFPRVVRDVSQDLGKQVNLVMEGKETELDRTIVEAIKDPLTHIVRNAIDHGIELPALRAASGKPEAGTLMLRAFHEGGQVNIEIMDDGQGINLGKVRQKAVERGVITSDQAARLTEREVINLIFLPGFSTADKITNVSGRGVGMDVVKTNIEKIGGVIDVSTEPGHGTTLRIKIPLTLAIIPALIVSAAGERFAIPQVSLLELVRLEGEQARQGIESLYDAPVYRLRGKLLPLIYLKRELHLAPPDEAGTPESVNIVVLQADGRQFGLIVDDVNDTEEIVVKPLGKQLRGISSFAGATIMGDGSVALILDVLGLAYQTGVVGERGQHNSTFRAVADNVDDARQTLLLFDAGTDTKLAIPLSAVSRLEEFPRAQIEHSGGQDLVQYRGDILPLVHVREHISGQSYSGELPETVQVVVYTKGGKSVGLVVTAICDIVHEELVAKRDVRRQGILGSAVVQGKVTGLLDVDAIVRAADPEGTTTAA